MTEPFVGQSLLQGDGVGAGNLGDQRTVLIAPAVGAGSGDGILCRATQGAPAVAAARALAWTGAR